MARGRLTIRLCGRAAANESVPAASGPEPGRARLDRGSSGQAPARQGGVWTGQDQARPGGLTATVTATAERARRL